MSLCVYEVSIVEFWFAADVVVVVFSGVVIVDWWATLDSSDVLVLVVSVVMASCGAACDGGGGVGVFETTGSSVTAVSVTCWAGLVLAAGCGEGTGDELATTVVFSCLFITTWPDGAKNRRLDSSYT